MTMRDLRSCQRRQSLGSTIGGVDQHAGQARGSGAKGEGEKRTISYPHAGKMGRGEGCSLRGGGWNWKSQVE